MKKLISIALAVITVLTVAVSAFATDIYTCPTCGKKYETLREFNACIDSHNADDPEESVPTLYTCETCGKKYYTLSELNDCIEEHRNSNEYKFDTFIGISVPDLILKGVSIITSSGIIDLLKELVEKIVSYIEAFIPTLMA